MRILCKSDMHGECPSIAHELGINFRGCDGHPSLRPFNAPRGVLGPFGLKVGNGVAHEFPGPSGPGAQKVKNGVEKESKNGKVNYFSTLFRLFFDSVFNFLDHGAEGPGNSFSTPFPPLGPKGPRAPLGGVEGSQIPRAFL